MPTYSQFHMHTNKSSCLWKLSVGRGRTATAGGWGCSHGSGKEAKNVRKWKRKHRAEALHGDSEGDQEIQARYIQEKAQS